MFSHLLECWQVPQNSCLKDSYSPSLCYYSLFDLYQCSNYAVKYTTDIKKEASKMEVFSNLFNDFTGWLTVGIIVFMLVMMAFLFSMFISKSKKDD